MKTVPTLFATIALSAGLLVATGANAALTASDGGIYDTDLNITWLANANLAATEHFGVSGITVYGTMNWYTAQSWIAGMNAANYLGHNDWRLPTTTDTGTPGCNFSYNGTDCGYNSTGSEMAHLYYNELGNQGFASPTGSYSPNPGLVDDPANPNDESLFANLQYAYYWSGTEYAPDISNSWYFMMGGRQGMGAKYDAEMYALVVRDGQVASVPVPAAAWLLGSGLLGLVGVARCKAA